MDLVKYYLVTSGVFFISPAQSGFLKAQKTFGTSCRSSSEKPQSIAMATGAAMIHARRHPHRTRSQRSPAVVAARMPSHSSTHGAAALSPRPWTAADGMVRGARFGVAAVVPRIAAST